MKRFLVWLGLIGLSCLPIAQADEISEMAKLIVPLVIVAIILGFIIALLVAVLLIVVVMQN